MWWPTIGALLLIVFTSPSTAFQDYPLDLPELPSLEQMADSLSDYKLETLADLDAYTEALRSIARLQIAKSFSSEARRFKRELDDNKSANVTALKVSSFNPAIQDDDSSWIYSVSSLEIFVHEGKTYFITGGLSSDDISVVVMSPPHYQLSVIATFKLTSVTFERMDIAAAGIENDWLWMAFGSTTSRLVIIASLHLVTGQVTQTQSIPTRGVVGALHMFEAGDTLFLVMGERYHSAPGDTAGVSEIYMLMGRYFDRRDRFTLDCTGVHSITGFPDDGDYVIVIGMNNAKGTHVFELDPMSDRVTLVQELSESKVLQVVHYRDAHDFKHYLIIRSEGSQASVYWWDNSQLLQWQILQTGLLSQSASLGYITLGNLETVIFVANRGVITVFADDQTGHYFKTFSVTTSCSSILEMHGVITSQTYYIYYICVSAVRRLERRVLTFHEIVFGTPQGGADTLLECLNHLNNTFEARKPSIEYLEDIVSNERLMTVDHDQVWTGPIVFTDLTVTATSSFENTVNIVNLNQPDSSTPQSLVELEASTSNLEAEIAGLQGQLSMVLFNDGNQTITGPIDASSLIIDNLDVDYLEIGTLNGVEVSELTSTFLLDMFDQTITGRLRVDSLSVDSLRTRLEGPHGRINSFLTSELMRRSVGNQVVTGNHSYNTIVIGEICNNLCDGFPVDINGIDTSTIVLQGGDASFRDRKIFTGANVEGELTADLINGINIHDLSSHVIYNDVLSLQTLDGRYILDGVEVKGNVETASINGINLRQLEDSVVKTRGNYRIAGDLIYDADVVVSSGLLSDTINGIPWTDFVDVNSPDLITGMYSFNDVTVLGSLISDDVNGLDFSQDVALTDKPQTINGRITFTQSVEVTGPSGVLMEEGGTINGIDPSELDFRHSTLDKITITDSAIFSGLLDITGDINVKSINGLVLDGIENRYWSLTKDQTIRNPVQLDNAIFNGPVEATTLNGRPLSDYLHDYGNELVNGRLTFVGNVNIEGDLIMDPGRTIDGVDVYELKHKIVTLTGHQAITGPINFLGKVTIIGDLDLGGKLNGIDITRDVLRLDRTSTHTGRLIFSSKVKINVLNIVDGDLTLETLNGLDLVSAKADLVLADENVVISGGGGLQFSGQVKINELYVSKDVDGINLGNLVSNALLKNSNQPQVIDSRLLVGGDAEFLGGLNVDRVNGKNFTQHLDNIVTLDYSGPISGHKVFTQDIEISGNFNPLTINGIDLSVLASRILTLSGEQDISGFYTFTQDIDAKVVFAPVIDGVDMAEILLIDRPEEVSGTVTFETDVHLLGGLNSDHYVLDGCNIRDIATSGVTGGSGDTNFDNNVMIDRLVVKGNVASAANFFVGGLELQKFLNSLVLKSTDQVISAPIQFGDATIDNLSAQTINGVNINDLFRLAARMDEDNVINCDVRFTNGLRVGSLTILSSLSGRGGGGVLVNGLDISDIAARAVLDNGGTVLISGTKTFLNGLVVDNLVVPGSLNGIPVSNLVALSRTDVLVRDLRFTSGIIVLGSLQVTGFVDGVNLDDFVNNRLNLNSSQTMFTSCTFESIRVEGDLEISQINDVLLSDLVIRSASSQTVSGKKEFRGGLHVNGNINVDTINGIDIDDLLHTIVRQDVDTTIDIRVTFNAQVTSLVDVFVDGRVNGFDLSELSAGNLSDHLIRQYLRIEDIRSQFGSITEENFNSALEMFAVLSYLERVRFPRDVNVTGGLWVGRIPEVGEGQFLKVTYCPRPAGQPCGCDAECHYYQVADDAALVPYVKLGYKVNILGHALSSNLYISIYSGCVEGVASAQVRVVQADGRNGFVQRLSLGLVSDSGLFVDNGKNYLVTVSQFMDERDDQETTSINVLTPVVGAKTIASVWTKISTLNAIGLDLAQIEGTWHLLVTNDYDAANTVDPYSAKSELFVWDSYAETFTLKGEYVADHVTSGKFLVIEEPEREYFISLTQYKMAQFSMYADNLEFTTYVLIYKYNKETKEFVGFQYLDVYGAMDQTLLKVDKNYYILVVSKQFNKLYVYQYYHSEGFVLHSSVRVTSPRSVAVLYLKSGTYVAVSTPDGLERFLVKTKGLDPDNLLLRSS